MDTIAVKKLNEVLNTKNIKCLSCDRQIQFVDGDSNEDYGVLNYKSFKCKCGVKHDGIKDSIYVISSFGEKFELAHYLYMTGIFEMDCKSIDEIYEILDDIDEELQDRTSDGTSSDISIEDAIKNFEEYLKAKAKDEGISQDEINRRIFACKELYWDDFISEQKDNWLKSDEWEKVELHGIGIAQYIPHAYINGDTEQMLIKIDDANGEVVVAAFDIKKLNRLIYLDPDKTDARVQKTVLLLIGANLIRRFREIPEIVYIPPNFYIDTLINRVQKQIVSGDIVIFGQDKEANDWTIDNYSSKEFSFDNCRGSKIEFKIKEDSGNFMHLDVEAHTVGNEAGTSNSSVIVDKLSCSILRHRTYECVNHLFNFIDIAENAASIFEYVANIHNHKSLEKLADNLRARLHFNSRALSEILTKEEIEEIKNMETYKWSKKLPIIKNDYYDKQDYKDIFEMSNINTATNMIWSLQDYDNYVDIYEDILDELCSHLDRVTTKLVEKHTIPKLVAMINESYNKEDAEYIIDTNTYLELAIDDYYKN